MNVINVHDISGRKQNHIYDNLFVFFHSALISTRILSSCFLLLFLNFRVCVLLGNQSVPTDCNRLIKKKKKNGYILIFSRNFNFICSRININDTFCMYYSHFHSVEVISIWFQYLFVVPFELHDTAISFKFQIKTEENPLHLFGFEWIQREKEQTQTVIDSKQTFCYVLHGHSMWSFALLF